MRRGAPARRPVGPPAAAAGRGREGPAQLAVRVWMRLLVVHKRGFAALREDLEREMTMARFDLLASLVSRDGQTLASLSRGMLATAGNVRGLVGRAARDGMVERRADPADRRAWRVYVTPKGLRAFREASLRYAAQVTKLFAGLTKTELAALLRLLDKVRHGLREPEAASVGSRGAGARPHEARAAPSRRRGRPKREGG
jgi:DNA-binding MarR family transcriptional regulator